MNTWHTFYTLPEVGAVVEVVGVIQVGKSPQCGGMTCAIIGGSSFGKFRTVKEDNTMFFRAMPKETAGFSASELKAWGWTHWREVGK